ncbi:DUF2786 domain-containing protein [Trabulsiella odontotermitis]|uniref:DUF2786 domain-containing protein n=1 Tax=Trabulsiella odontotermitis TaxID=379893 RepID=UPI0006761BAA|nr:DUF2786 domain-containing protein [Trabulsiella odontotermitis]KNC89689.1 hypothetical protein GM30_06640 [Trabulsiella odontotermitis]
MNREKYLAKIKKLLNLARKSTNTNEAAAALRQAQNMMREHNVSEVEAEFTGISEASTKGAPNHAQTPPKYLIYLVEIIKRAFGVQAYFTWRETKFFYRNPRRVVTFYGPDSRPQIAAYAFDVLARQMTTARKAFISELHRNTKPANRTAKADQFCEGWASGVWHIVAELVPTESETTLMEVYRERQLTGMKTATSREARQVAGSDFARAEGYRSGRQAQLSHGVDGTASETKLIGGRV